MERVEIAVKLPVKISKKTDNMSDDIDKTLNNISEAFGIEPSKIDILG